MSNIVDSLLIIRKHHSRFCPVPPEMLPNCYFLCIVFPQPVLRPRSPPPLLPPGMIARRYPYYTKLKTRNVIRVFSAGGSPGRNVPLHPGNKKSRRRFPGHPASPAKQVPESAAGFLGKLRPENRQGSVPGSICRIRIKGPMPYASRSPQQDSRSPRTRRFHPAAHPFSP